MKGPHLLSQSTIVIPSGVAGARSAAATESRDLLSARTLIRPFWQIVLVAILFASIASAQTLTGTVKNSTTGKPSAGDEVVLLSLGQGMEEAGRTKADAKGNFTFKLDAQGPHLVRVIHQEVTYHRMAPPGTTSVEVEVYDVGKKIEGIEVVADIMRFQAGQGQLQVERTFAVNNNSKPPRTQMNEHNLEFFVPDGATIGEAQAMTAGGQPVKSAPVPEGANAKNKYAFLFPLRPGETRFNVVYTVPYTGSVNIDPKSAYPWSISSPSRPRQWNSPPLPEPVFKSLPIPANPTPTSRSPRTRDWANPWHSSFPEKAHWLRLQKMAASPARAAPPRKAITAPAAVSVRPSTPPTLCRNIAGISSEDSQLSSSSAESS